MKDIEKILFTENELEAIKKNEEAKLMVGTTVNGLWIGLIVGALIGKGIATEDEISFLAERLATTDQAKKIAGQIKQFVGV